jgi:heat shock protein HslJ
MKTIKILILLCVSVLVFSACGKSGSSEEITGILWQWTAMQETVPASLSAVPDPQNYTITFNTDGSVDIKADCNTVNGTYEMKGSDLTITLGASTLMACGEASQDVSYLAALSKVSSYAVVDGQLQLKFADDAGKMDFQNGGAAQ